MVKMPDVSGANKRIVFIHDDGIHQIIGHCDGELPVTLAGDGAVIETRGRQIPFASLVKVTARAAWYRAPVVPQSYGSFHKEQR